MSVVSKVLLKESM